MLLVPGAGGQVPVDLSLLLPGNVINLDVTSLLLPIRDAAALTARILFVLQDQVELEERPSHHLDRIQFSQSQVFTVEKHKWRISHQSNLT